MITEVFSESSRSLVLYRSIEGFAARSFKRKEPPGKPGGIPEYIFIVFCRLFPSTVSENYGLI